ncbi:MAG: CCA tRNA nucleotidyltransferase [Patescibacteria group bacterium]|jgi:poly(A) polymerase/tRNA nucleotidyltransferase (CCA-adding enzyme)
MEIPKEIRNILQNLEKNNFEAYIVGGCVRDLLLLASFDRTTNAAHANIKTEPKDAQTDSRAPKDWDITTNAKPEEIMKVFPNSKYENEFGTVIVKSQKLKAESTEPEIKAVEVTTYRSEQGYSDRRHPDEIKFEDSLNKDLERRDFTINAMAIGHITHNTKRITPKNDSRYALRDTRYAIIDLFGGQKDIKKKIIRAVGEPVDRFKEDALRMMRAIRFSVQLGFEIEPKTERAIIKLAGAIKFVSKERIHNELVKILQSDKPAEGILLLQKTKLLQYIIPELENCVGVKQNKHHTYTVFKHAVESLRHIKNKEYQVRLASLLHDIGKPKAKDGKGEEATFHNHEYAGAKITKKIMERLKFSRDDIDRVTNLIRHHMFYYNTDEVTAASVRRLINKVGKENLQDLIDLRVADRLGSGTPKAMPYKLRHLQYMMEKVQNDPVSVKMLKINGDELMPLLKIKPGPKIGAILEVLLAEVIEDPELNNKKHLEKRSKELNKMELEELRVKAKDVIQEKREIDDSKMKRGFYVK